MLRVSDGSKGADAGQLFHNLLLSKKAEADSIPELEVSEHDVVGCGHGTANGPVDEEQLFYLEARGFSPDDAKDALICGFSKYYSLGNGERNITSVVSRELAR